MAHMLNSAGLLKYPEYAMDGVRVGSAILGRVCLCAENWGLVRIGECRQRWKNSLASEGPQLRLRRRAGQREKPTRVPFFPWAGTTGSAWEMGNDSPGFRDRARAAFCGI